ncbi:MAG: hypothetical protein QOG03_243 [Actinomycetota bacterium]|jgi:hypothetical protein|nr:hypothetical protein [Actinomycetota bacterium]
MAKVTVYVKDEQLKTLKEEMGGASKAFQAFIDEVGGGDRPIEIVDGRGMRRPRRRRRVRGDEFAARIMPTTSALDRLAAEVGDDLGDDGPRAESGPVSFALSVLTYKAVTARHPQLEEVLRKEFTRFSLDELVEAAADGFDPEARREDEEDEGKVEVRTFRIRGGDLEAVESDDDDLRPRGGRRRGRGGARHVQIVVGSEDDPAELLDEGDLARFKAVHEGWSQGSTLGPDELKTLSDLLRRRFAEPSED